MAAHQAAFEQGDSELWYVATGPGETKLLTLEQLDDLFRLEIIDADTRLWQPGMREWLPLSVVAGLDEPSKPVAPPPPSARVPRAPSPPTRSGPPPAPVRAAPAPVRPLPAPAPAPRPAPLPAPISMNSLPPGRPVPVSVTASTWPAASPVSAAPARNPFAPPESLRPITFSQPPRVQPSGSGGFGRFVLMLAVLSGVGVTLYRNDMLRRAAVAAGQEKTYLKLEAALGGPGFGTPRAVAALLTPSSSVAAATLPSSTYSSRSSLPSTQTSPSTSTAATTEAKSASSTTTAQPASRETGSATREASAPSRESGSTTREASSAPRENSLAASMAASIGGSKAKSAPSPAPAPRQSAPSRGKSNADDSSKGLGFKGGNSTYDPLNGKL
ncbi:MAG: hypothetical protein ACOY0T_24720 [Myxococcota bacterium]